ncbi:hypothetical protein [Flaviaesturariibacter amylovorans]|uniref:Lipoprotein n=1 Tax=Flaviaesturariibacter amylovorans TaxID=1084520 RepID=A0ABP8GLK4_9BACT
MRNTFLLLILGTSLIGGTIVSCTREHIAPPQAPPVPMTYTDFKDSAIRFGKHASFDLDQNGSADIGFSTLLVSDPLTQTDKRQWYAFGTFNTFFAVNNNEEMPFLGVNVPITKDAFSGYEWYNASSIVIAQQVLSNTEPPRWEGTWKEATHRYFPLQVKRGDSLYHGWAEISFRTADQQLYLHRAGLATVAGAAVRTGQ